MNRALYAISVLCVASLLNVGTPITQTHAQTPQAAKSNDVNVDSVIEYLQKIRQKQNTIDKNLLQNSIASCSNGYACEPPDHIPPGCGSCTCTNIP